MSVYALVDPRDDRPRYVGRSANPDSRFRAHLSPSTAQRKVALWVAELRRLGLKPRLAVFAMGVGTEAEMIQRLQPDLNIYPGETEDEDSDAVLRDCQIQIRVSHEEKVLMEAAARRDRLPLATWIRRIAMEAAEVRP